MMGFILVKRRFDRVFGAEGKKSVQLESIFVAMMKVREKEKLTFADGFGVPTADLAALAPRCGCYEVICPDAS